MNGLCFLLLSLLLERHVALVFHDLHKNENNKNDDDKFCCICRDWNKIQNRNKKLTMMPIMETNDDGEKENHHHHFFYIKKYKCFTSVTIYVMHIYDFNFKFCCCCCFIYGHHEFF